MSEQEQTPDEAQVLQQKVAEHIEQGDLTAAKQILSKGWRELVPPLPTRFSVELISLDRKAVKEVLSRWKKTDNKPPLKLIEENDGYSVVTQRGKRLRLGRLPASEAKMMLQLQTKAKSFKPHLIKISSDEQGVIDSVTVELVRPQPRICTSCGKTHYDDHPNCKQCRSKRARRGPEQFEHTPLPVQEAIEALAEHAEDGEEN